MPSEFKKFKQQLNFNSEPYNLTACDAEIIVPLLADWNQVKSSNNDTKILGKVMKIYDEAMKLSKCLMHYDLKQIKERLSKLSNDKKRQNITNVLNQTEKLLDQVNYDIDKETTIKNGKQLSRSIYGILQTIGMGKLGQMVGNTQMNPLPYILGSYAHNFYAKGKTPPDLKEIAMKTYEP